MNVLDENFPQDKREQLIQFKIPVRQIGKELSASGASDSDLLSLLHSLPQPTFFTQDNDFFKRQLCHRRYCLVWLDLPKDSLALYVRLILKHRCLRTWRLRAGAVVRAHSVGLDIWRPNTRSIDRHTWPS
jgi:hypothetical protein